MNHDVDYYRERLHRELPDLADRFHVASLSLFGSYVRRQNRLDSDLDVLVDFTKTPTLFELVELESHLSDVLQVKVDLGLRTSLRPHVADRVLRELVDV